MGFRFRRTIRILPGVRLNISKGGISTSIGRPGATINIGRTGTRATVGLPGTGLSYSEKLGTARPIVPGAMLPGAGVALPPAAGPVPPRSIPSPVTGRNRRLLWLAVAVVAVVVAVLTA